MKKRNLLVAAVLVLAVASCKNNTSEGTVPETGDSTATGTFNPVTNPPDSVVTNTAAADSSTAPSPVDKNEKNYKSDKGETIAATYHDSGDMGVAEIKISGEGIKLMKSGKKNGATIYTNGKLTWTVKAGEASLEKDNVVTVYKENK